MLYNCKDWPKDILVLSYSSTIWRKTCITRFSEITSRSSPGILILTKTRRSYLLWSPPRCWPGTCWCWSHFRFRSPPLCPWAWHWHWPRSWCPRPRRRWRSSPSWARRHNPRHLPPLGTESPEHPWQDSSETSWCHTDVTAVVWGLDEESHIGCHGGEFSIASLSG